MQSQELARRESPALIRSFQRDFSPAHRPIAPTVENFFVRRVEGCRPLHRIVARRIFRADIARERVPQLCYRIKKRLCRRRFFNPLKIAR